MRPCNHTSREILKGVVGAHHLSQKRVIRPAESRDYAVFRSALDPQAAEIEVRGSAPHLKKLNKSTQTLIGTCQNLIIYQTLSSQPFQTRSWGYTNEKQCHTVFTEEGSDTRKIGA